MRKSRRYVELLIPKRQVPFSGPVNIKNDTLRLAAALQVNQRIDILTRVVGDNYGDVGSVVTSQRNHAQESCVVLPSALKYDFWLIARLEILHPVIGVIKREAAQALSQSLHVVARQGALAGLNSLLRCAHERRLF